MDNFNKGGFESDLSKPVNDFAHSESDLAKPINNFGSPSDSFDTKYPQPSDSWQPDSWKNDKISDSEVKPSYADGDLSKLENDSAEKMKEEVQVKMTCKEHLQDKKAEYERQVKGQEEGLNNLTLKEYLENREKYKENGRDKVTGDKAQQKAREEAYQDRVTANRENGMTREASETEAEEWLSGQAALHDPDQIAGGHADRITGVGDTNVNSSIGAQWKVKIEAVDNAVNNYIKENNLSKEDLANTKLNLKIEVI